MKKFFAVIICAMLSVNVANAQLDKLLNKAKEVAGAAASKASGNSSSTIASIANVISSKLVPTSSQIVGTWTYQKPAVMFTSSNALKSAAGSLGSAAVENKLQTYLSKVGITKGKMAMVFESDKTFSVTLSGKKIASGTYTIEGNEVSLTFKGKKNPCKVTPQLDNGTLVIVMDATKLKTFMENLGNNVSQLASVVSLLKQADGMKIGVRLGK